MNARTSIPDLPEGLQATAMTSYADDCDVTVVIPMRNEEANVAPLCAELQEVMDKEPLRYEVIIINDGSTDGTASELSKATQDDPRFTVVELYSVLWAIGCVVCRFSYGARQDHRSDGRRPAERSSRHREVDRRTGETAWIRHCKWLAKEPAGQTVHAPVSVAGRECSHQAPDLVQ